MKKELKTEMYGVLLSNFEAEEVHAGDTLKDENDKKWNVLFISRGNESSSILIEPFEYTENPASYKENFTVVIKTADFLKV